MGTHKRLGKDSAIRLLSKSTLQTIYEYYMELVEKELDMLTVTYKNPPVVESSIIVGRPKSSFFLRPSNAPASPSYKEEVKTGSSPVGSLVMGSRTEESASTKQTSSTSTTPPPETNAVEQENLTPKTEENSSPQETIPQDTSMVKVLGFFI